MCGIRRVGNLECHGHTSLVGQVIRCFIYLCIPILALSSNVTDSSRYNIQKMCCYTWLVLNRTVVWNCSKMFSVRYYLTLTIHGPNKSPPLINTPLMRSTLGITWGWSHFYGNLLMHPGSNYCRNGKQNKCHLILLLYQCTLLLDGLITRMGDLSSHSWPWVFTHECTMMWLLAIYTCSTVCLPVNSVNTV